MTGKIEKRYERQEDIIPIAKDSNLEALVIGVGAIGRQVAMQLAASGVPKLYLVDMDVVEPQNLAVQGFLEKDLGRSKVDAVGDMCRQINGEIEINTKNSRYNPQDLRSAVFCCVDKIGVRRAIWRNASTVADFFCDARMIGEMIRIVTASNGVTGHYEGTLFSAEEAETGRCTSRSTIFAANIAAGLMLEQFSRWLRGFDTDPDLFLNLFSSEMWQEAETTVSR